MKKLTLILVFFAASTAAEGVQTSADAFTRYELLPPETHSFRIYYDVSAATAGATRYYNPIRRGSKPTAHAVYDRLSGEQLGWSVVEGADARESGLLPDAGADSQFIRVDLARPVPREGRGRVLIDKTYQDAASYYADGDTITFSRTLGVKRNAVTLPHGYELESVNYPSQVVTLADGRIETSFINPGTVGVPYEIKARPLDTAPDKRPTRSSTPGESPTMTSQRPVARTGFEIPQRASQSRDIVYFLQAPDTHSFRLYHDYEEKRAGMDRYLNIVRPGSKASEPSAENLDTGEPLKVEMLSGTHITDRGIDIGEPITDDTQLVAIWFKPVVEGGSTLLRISETYTDPNRYFMDGEEFVWDRSFGRSRNTVVLPEGWYLTANAVPAVVRTRGDGRVELIYSNDRPGDIDVFLKGRRRTH